MRATDQSSVQTGKGWEALEGCSCNSSTDLMFLNPAGIVQPQKAELTPTGATPSPVCIPRDTHPTIPSGLREAEPLPGAWRSENSSRKSCPISPARGLSGFLSGWQVRAFCRNAVFTCRGHTGSYWGKLVCLCQKKATWKTKIIPVFKGNPLGPGHGCVWKELGLLKAVFTSRCLVLQQLNLR